MTLQSEALEELAVDISNYWQAYGLTQEPYGLGNDPSLYVSLPRFEEHLDLLQYLCNYNNLLLVITGIAGSGKTTLMHQLANQLSETAHVCQLHADHNSDASRLLEFLAENFALPWNPEAPFDEQLDAQIVQIQNHDKLCVLTIDNAHLLAGETLEALLYFIRQQSETQMRLHVVLFGEPVLQESLAQLTEADEVELVHALNLAPLDLEETRQYLEQRLAAVGWQDALPFTNDAVSRIYRLSEGVPARINRIARRTLLDKITKQQESEDVEFLTEHKTKFWGAGFIILALLVFGLIINHVRHEPVSPKQALVAFDQAASQAEPATVQATEPAQLGTTATDKPAITNLAGSPPASTTASTSTASQASLNNNTKTVANDMSTGKSAAIILEPSDNSQSEVQAVPIQTIADKTADLPQANVGKDDPHLTHKQEIVVKPEASQDTKTHKPSKAYTNDEHFLLQIPSHHYTIQIIGLSREASIHKLIQDNHLSGRAYYFRTLLNGKDFYILVYGNYATRQAAMAAIHHLPIALQAFKPWPREFAQIHTNLQMR